jgi:hypothetical protein
MPELDRQYLDSQAISQALIKASAGIKKYHDLMIKLHETNVAKDIDYQRSFNHFYRIRQRSAEWYATFYELLEESKNSNISFEFALRHIYHRLDRIEPSFSSKLVATINPELPVWDKYVLENFRLHWSYTGKKELRVKHAIATYKSICERMDAFKKMDIARQIVIIFDAMYPALSQSVTITKKVDFTLWQLR